MYTLFDVFFWLKKRSQWIKGLASSMASTIFILLAVSTSNFDIPTRILWWTEIGDFKSSSEMMSKANGGMGVQLRIVILGLFVDTLALGERSKRSLIDVASVISFQVGRKKVVTFFLNKERESTWDMNASMPKPMTFVCITVGFRRSPSIEVRLWIKTNTSL